MAGVADGGHGESPSAVTCARPVPAARPSAAVRRGTAAGRTSGNGRLGRAKRPGRPGRPGAPPGRPPPPACIGSARWCRSAGCSTPAPCSTPSSTWARQVPSSGRWCSRGSPAGVPAHAQSVDIRAARRTGTDSARDQQSSNRPVDSTAAARRAGSDHHRRSSIAGTGTGVAAGVIGRPRLRGPSRDRAGSGRSSSRSPPPASTRIPWPGRSRPVPAGSGPAQPARRVGCRRR